MPSLLALCSVMMLVYVQMEGRGRLRDGKSRSIAYHGPARSPQHAVVGDGVLQVSISEVPDWSPRASPPHGEPNHLMLTPVTFPSHARDQAPVYQVAQIRAYI